MSKTQKQFEETRSKKILKALCEANKEIAYGENGEYKAVCIMNKLIKEEVKKGIEKEIKRMTSLETHM